MKQLSVLSLYVSPGEWSSPNITGQSPPPCSSFTLTQVGESKAALFGGESISGPLSDLFVVELSRHTVVSVVRNIIYSIGQENLCCLLFVIEASKTMIEILIIAHRKFFEC